MPCEIQLEAIQAGPPYLLGTQPVEMRVVGRASADCTDVRVTVRAGGAGSVALIDQVAPVSFTQPPGDPGALPGVFALPFPQPALVALSCGDALWVDAVCVSDPACTATGLLRIECKPPPGGAGGGNDDDDDHHDDNDGVGDPWPPVRCLFTAAAAAMALLAALTCIALGIATQNPALIATGAALLGGVAFAWSLWDFWCNPTLCTRLGVLCWVLKRAFIAALPMIPFSTSALILLVIVTYGTAAGILVHRLRVLGCPVPSARLPLTQLPI